MAFALTLDTPSVSQGHPDILTPTKQIRADQLDFKNRKELGKGSSGSVWSLSFRTGAGEMKEVVAKEISTSEARAMEEIRRELQVFAECNCPFIVRFHGIVTVPTLPQVMLILEKMDGSLLDLFEHTPSRKVSEGVARAIARQVCEALQYLHRGKIDQYLIHRDLKPSNILFNLGGEVKLTDFGVSSRPTQMEASCHTFVGSIGYMSPERLTKSSHSCAADIWSLGITLLEGLMGRHPLAHLKIDDNAQGMLSAGRKLCEDPPRVSDELQVSKECASFINGCLEVDPAKRLGTLDMLAHAWMVSMNVEESKEIVKSSLSVLPSQEQRLAQKGASLQKKLRNLQLGI
eukprot:PhF_6_TR6969/c4_g1_i1/m.10295